MILKFAMRGIAFLPASNHNTDVSSFDSSAHRMADLEFRISIWVFSISPYRAAPFPYICFFIIFERWHSPPNQKEGWQHAWKRPGRHIRDRWANICPASRIRKLLFPASFPPFHAVPFRSEVPTRTKTSRPRPSLATVPLNKRGPRFSLAIRIEMSTPPTRDSRFSARATPS